MGEWIAWEGGECPVPAGTPIVYRIRGQDGVDRHTAFPAHLAWLHCGSRGDIVAYRLSTPTTKPRSAE